MKKTTYLSYVRTLADAERRARERHPAPAACPPPPVEPGTTDVLLFSPHPDDESITGALPLRLGREAGFHIVNVAVTLGSNHGERARRLRELHDACGFLGFGLICSQENGLDHVNPQTRQEHPEDWKKKVELIAAIIRRHQPKYIFLPHANDWNQTHIGTHHLVMDALKSTDDDICATLVETEYWGALPDPNIVIETSMQDTADLVTAVAYHRGEVARNAFHTRLPALMLDNVRRGGEIVGGQGAIVPPLEFATLYKISRWNHGTAETITAAPFICTADKLTQPIESLLQ